MSSVDHLPPTRVAASLGEEDWYIVDVTGATSGHQVRTNVYTKVESQ